jgi:hypothetical protein
MKKNKIIIIPNADKSFHEEWYKARDALNFPHPYRAILIGRPNCGKSMVAKNLILKQKPEFKRLVVVHCDPDYTKEYDDTGVQPIAEIPSVSYFDGEDKTLVILDDLDFKNLSRQQEHRLNRLYGNWSTHKNISIILCSQDCFQLKPIVRRLANVWIIWKPTTKRHLIDVSNAAGIEPKFMSDMFKNHINDPHSALWLDKTKKSPYPIRIDGYRLVKNIINKSYK